MQRKASSDSKKWASYSTGKIQEDQGKRCSLLWGAHAPRVLIAAPRRNALGSKSAR